MDQEKQDWFSRQLLRTALINFFIIFMYFFCSISLLFRFWNIQKVKKSKILFFYWFWNHVTKIFGTSKKKFVKMNSIKVMKKEWIFSLFAVEVKNTNFTLRNLWKLQPKLKEFELFCCYVADLSIQRNFTFDILPFEPVYKHVFRAFQIVLRIQHIEHVLCWKTIL